MSKQIFLLDGTSTTAGRRRRGYLKKRVEKKKKGSISGDGGKRPVFYNSPRKMTSPTKTPRPERRKGAGPPLPLRRKK